MHESSYLPTDDQNTSIINLKKKYELSLQSNHQFRQFNQESH